MKSIANCVASLEKSPICKRNKLKKVAVQEFVVQIYLVVRGVRRSYLVDCFALDAGTLEAVLKLTLIALSVSNSPLVVVQLPTDDFFVLSAAAFTERVELCPLLDHVLLVDISGDGNPHIMNASEVLPVVEHFTSLIHDIVQACHESLSAGTSNSGSSGPHVLLLPLAPDTAVVGYECLAGWLLGYSCVYNCATSREDSSSQYRNSLSLLPLLQKSITVQVQLRSGDACTATVQEFTVPLCVFGEHDAAATEGACSTSSRGLSEVSAEQFESLVQRELEEVRAACDRDPFLSNVFLDSSELTVSSLAF